MTDRKQQILDDLKAARAEVLELVGRMSPAQLDLTTANEGWSVKDTLAHLSSIEVRVRSLLQHALEGRAWPADAVDLHTFNARCVAERRSWPAEAIVDELRQTGRESDAAIDRLAPDDLDRQWDHPTRGTLTIDDIARILPRHLREHAKEIEAALRA